MFGKYEKKGRKEEKGKKCRNISRVLRGRNVHGFVSSMHRRKEKEKREDGKTRPQRPNVLRPLLLPQVCEQRMLHARYGESRNTPRPEGFLPLRGCLMVPRNEIGKPAQWTYHGIHVSACDEAACSAVCDAFEQRDENNKRRVTE